MKASALTFAVQSFVTLFVIMDPPGATPIFLALVADKSPKERRVLAIKAASVCSALINELPDPESPAVTGRFFALIIPRVTVPERPSGEPIAITESPTATLSLSPNSSAGRLVPPILIMAKS